MALTDYMSNDEVRVATGLSSLELTDAELALDVYLDRMTLEALEVDVPTDIGSSDLLTEYATVEGIDESSRTTLQEKFYYYTRLFLIYCVAAEVMTAISLKAPKTESDGKASKVRFSSEATFRDAQKNVMSKFSYFKACIEALPDSPTDILPVSLFVVSPETDVVTNE